MERQELSLALLHQAVFVVALLGKLLPILPRRNKTLLNSLKCLYSKLENFTRGLWATMKSIDDTWWHRDVTSNDKVPPTSVSRALAAYRSTPWTTWDDVTMVACEWQGSLNGRLDNWAQLDWKATELRQTCREVATEATIVAAIATAQARRLRAKAARGGTAREGSTEQGRTLGGQERAEVVSRREAWVATKLAKRAIKERRQVKAALRLLEHLVVACKRVTAFSCDLWSRAVHIEAALEAINEASDVPEDLVAEVAEAEQLWEANARLMKDHLLGTVGDINKFFTGGRAGPRAREVAKRCRRAIRNIQREHPHGVPKVSPASAEPRELSLALLKPKPLVTLVAILGELVGITARLDVLLPVCQPSLHEALEKFAERLRGLLRGLAEPLWQRRRSSAAAAALTSLRRALAAYESTAWTSWQQVSSVASEWHELLSAFEDGWAQLTAEATRLRDTCRDVAAGRGAEETSRRGAAVGTAREASEGEMDAGGSEAAENRPRAAAGMSRRAEEAWGLLKHLVMACRKSAALHGELRRGAAQLEDALGAARRSRPSSRSALAAKAAEIERLWVASSLLARDHLVVALGDICAILRRGDPDGSIGREVAERCRRATEDILTQLQGQ